MKLLSISGFILGILSFLASLYLQFVLAPAAAALEASIDTGLSAPIDSIVFVAAIDAKVMLGEILIITGGLGLILSGISAIKLKSKLAMTGVVLGLIALVIGVIHGTHMFS